MKLAPAALVLLLVTLPAHAGTTVSVAQEVHDVTAADIEKHAVALLVSCDWEAPADIATAARWKRALGGSHVHLVFPEARKFSFTFSATGPAIRQEIAVKEILIPISAQRSPDYILVLDEDRMRAFAKYHDNDALLTLQKCLTRR